MFGPEAKSEDHARVKRTRVLQASIIPVTPFEQNCTLLFDSETKEGVVVDPGGDVDRILQTARENGIALKSIWLTHGHIDHAGAAKELKDAFSLEIVGPHKDDLWLLEGLEGQAKRYGLAMKVQNVLPDRWLDEGDTVSFGDHIFEVLHCPGHSPGHIAFFNRAQSIVHVGDVLFHGSIGRTNLRGGNRQQILNSIRDKILPLGDHVDFICGHGPGGQIGDERRHNPYLRGL
ncbi:MBL fold metallo-hydrolase [Ensifer adhaerens]|uniref:MBL fold metallo-hydrolase n=1 Tax=Ensifer adhaerens TaxID=106592 RepID=UPI00384B40C1